MRRERLACLLVVKDESLVGIVTERDFLHVTAQLLRAAASETPGNG